MKILFSTTYYDPYVSGLSLYVKRLAHSLGERSHSICVLCMRHEALLARSEGRGNVRVVRATPWMRMSKGFLSFDFIRQAHKEVYTTDVVVVNLPEFEGAIAAIFARLYQKKVIAVYHCEIVLPRGVWNRIIQFVLEFSNLLTLLLAHHVVTYTEDFAEQSRLLGLVRRLRKSTNIQTTYPPIPRPIVRQSVSATLKKKIGNADVIIGVAARLAAEKGIEYLLEAIPILVCHPGLRAGIQRRKKWIPGQARNDTRVKVVVAGPMEPVGEEAYKKKIMTLVEKYQKDIVFLGTLSEEDMGSFYSLLDVLVLPSVNSTESFGMVQVEAMMTGVPVIATNLPGVRVPVRVTGMGVLVAPRDTQGIVTGIQTILADRSMYKKNSREVQQMFSLKKTIAFYEKLF